ncbi:MAG: cyclic nucleotide-binding domain-containing protein [Desulfobacteraceae bacterium]|nr:cyclic nucleotide-binding domain-containing protein [Desulfobacteraceae bacterium]
MNVTCEKCKTVFAIDDSLIKKEGSRLRCSKCQHLFIVYSPAPEPSEPVPVFTIIAENNCPLYRLGEEFQLTSNVFLLPHNKPPCLILVKDVREAMKTINNTGSSEDVFSCGGCTGSIKFGLKASLIGKQDNYINAIASLLSRFSIFDGLDRNDLKDLVSFLRIDKFSKGDFVLRKGDPGRNLFLIISGKVDVLGDDGMSIATMGKGDVFGEMSLLSGDPVGATIKAAESTVVLEIGGDNFKKVLNRFPFLQMSVSRLIVRRMAEINLTRTEEFASGYAGKLSEMPPSDLFQAFNINQKTGVLTLKLPTKTAFLSFREGRLVDVRYSEKKGEEAFFELLKEKEGRFKFIPGLPPEELDSPEVGDFMYLLIEGLRRIDEDDRKFLRTVIPTLI